MSEFVAEKNKNLRLLCKMARAWKNEHGVGMGGLLIDTLAYNFLKSTTEYDNKSYLYYDWLSRDFFKYLADQPDQERYAALGSGQHVKVKNKFQKKAETAYDLCLEAISSSDQNDEDEKWKKVYGRSFAIAAISEQKSAFSASHSYRKTEEFIEDRFPIDIKHSLRIDCTVSQNGFRDRLLREILRLKWRLSPNKSLRFHVANHDIPGVFDLYWKILNRGSEAERRDCVRGQIIKDDGRNVRTETTSFNGDHLVDCYAVKAGIVVARNQIHVPITSGGPGII